MVTLPYCLMLAEIKLPKRKTRPCHVIKIFMKRWLTDKADNYLERAPVVNPSSIFSLSCDLRFHMFLA